LFCVACALCNLSLGNGVNGVYTATTSYNALLQPTDSKLTRVSDGAVLFEQQPMFDPVGNVSTVATTLPAGTDQQTFCYDEQDRLTWASAASGTIPCGGTNTAGTLTSATYTQSFGYDPLNRLTSGPAGSYTYGDSAHLHATAATAVPHVTSTWGSGTTWVPPTYYFAKKGGRAGRNTYIEHLGTSNKCDPIQNPECFEMFSDAFHDFKETSSIPNDNEYKPVAKMFARWYFKRDPVAWDWLFNRLAELMKQGG
jgi:hypothetical protein